VRCELELLVLFSFTYSSPYKPKHQAGFGICTDSVNRQKKRKRTRNFDHYERGKKWQAAAECVMRSIVILNAHQISGDKMKKKMRLVGPVGIVGG